MSDDLIIETRELTKRYGPVEAITALNLSIRPHSITAFLGLNGAGKTTTIKLLLGMIRPSSGNGLLLGHRIDDETESIEMRRQIAYVGENKRLYDYMTVEQIIRFTSSFYSDWSIESEKKYLRQYALPLDRKIRSLSKGMRTKLGLLLAFSRRPKLLILDEPSDGLDPVGIEELLQGLVTQCSAGTTVFFSSHQIAEVERIADHICMVNKGRLVLDTSLDDLRRSFRRIDLVFSSPPAALEFQIKGVEHIQTRGYQMSIVASTNSEEVVARAHYLQASSIDVTPVGLREIFLERAKEN